jgi:hypothetical protein
MIPSSSRPLKIIAVDDGHTDDYFWLSLDGDAESLTPNAILDAFPDLRGSTDILTGFEETAQLPPPIISDSIRPARACIAESRFATFIFTPDLALHQSLLERFNDCLPSR